MKRTNIVLLGLILILTAIAVVLGIFAYNLSKDDRANDDQIACTLEAKLCPDGSYVGRNPQNNCEFNECPAASVPIDEGVFCTSEAKLCLDGSYVGRNPKNNCEFDPCPGE